MKAIRYYRYGSPDVLRLQDVEMPTVGDNDVLVRVRAAAVNPLDFHYMRGKPYLMRPSCGLTQPKSHGLGADMSGVVEAVGPRVSKFRPGDEVFGGARDGTFAEYVAVNEDKAVLAKPSNLTFEQAAAVPIAAYTALQALRDRGRIRAGHKVLVNGAAGGVGTFAVQIARAYGAEVTGVCSTRNVDVVRSIGAARVIDYTQEDFTRIGRRYDILIDIAGNRSLADCRRVLADHGVLVGVGGPDNGNWIGPLARPIAMLVQSPIMSQSMVFFIARQSKDDLAVMAELLETRKVTPVIDRTYPLKDVPDAIRYLELGHARGKVVVTV
jgi:NADPH:quinone reductase-like Zn-dependent oxidoreductase